MRRVSAWIVSLLVLLSLVPAASAEGEESVRIDSVEDFLRFCDACAEESYSAGKTFELTADLDLSNTAFHPVPYFAGRFLGNHRLITGLADEAIAESSIQMMPDKGGVRVLSTSGEPISSILIYDIAGRLVMRSTPGLADCWLSLHRGVYAVKAATDNCQQLKKIIVE